MNKFNELHGNQTDEPPREWNIQPTAVQLKYCTSTPNNRPVVLDLMGRLNHHAVDNGDFDVYTLDCALEYNYHYVTDPDNTPIKSIDDDEIYQILELFHLEHDDDILDVDLHMLQA